MTIRSMMWCVVCLFVALAGVHCGVDDPYGNDELVILPPSDGGVDGLVPGDTSPPTDTARQEPANEVASEPAQEPPSSDTTEPPLLPDDGGSDAVSPDIVEPPADDVADASEPLPPDRVTPDPPAPLQSWIGEPCQRDSDCDVPNGICIKPSTKYPDGYCTAPCTSTCPDKAGKPVTFCIDDGSGKGTCVQRCSQVACRSGYDCQQRSRLGQPSTQHMVCVPKQPPPTGGSRTFLYIGDSQSSGSRFGSTMVAFLREPRTTCPAANTGKNTVYSYAKVSSASRHWSQASGSSKDWLCGATKVYTNGTAPSNTTGAQLCAGITGVSKSIFQKLIDTHKPNAFVIQLGGNSMGFAQSYVKSKIHAMLDHMPSGSLCFWVTPSASSSKYLAKRRDIEKWTREALQSYSRISCSMYTSIDEMLQQTSCSSFNSSDGIHMTSCGSALWGSLITKKMCQSGKL